MLHVQVDTLTLIVLTITILIKSILFIVAWRIHSSSSLVLAQDQINDVVSNSVAIAGAFIGQYRWPLADPIGALIVWLALFNIILIFVFQFSHRRHMVSYRHEADSTTRRSRCPIGCDQSNTTTCSHT